jgi:hypothetical protein
MKEIINGCHTVEHTDGSYESYFDWLMNKLSEEEENTKKRIREEAKQTAKESEGEI